RTTSRARWLTGPRSKVCAQPPLRPPRLRRWRHARGRHAPHAGVSLTPHSRFDLSAGRSTRCALHHTRAAGGGVDGQPQVTRPPSSRRAGDLLPAAVWKGPMIGRVAAMAPGAAPIAWRAAIVAPPPSRAGAGPPPSRVGVAPRRARAMAPSVARSAWPAIPAWTAALGHERNRCPDVERRKSEGPHRLQRNENERGADQQLCNTSHVPLLC